jgi:magnesium-transporting ATPase (P-type)
MSSSLLSSLSSDLANNLANRLEPIAAWFRSFNLPEPIVHWGHPLMMAIVVFVMGSVVGITGWRGREAVEPKEAATSRANHRQIAPLMFLFIVLGSTGGVLSLVMQQKPILESPHFWTGAVVLVLLGTNAAIAATDFGKNKPALRTAHAYLGSTALCLLFLHALLGLKLGLAI